MNPAPLIKVCGMRMGDNIADVAMLCPDMLGFIFYSKSPRYALADGDAGLSEAMLHTTISRVGVFVNEDMERIVQLAKQYRLDYIQLHGDESPQYCRQLQEQGCALIKAFAVQTEADLCRTSLYDGLCRYFLFDTLSAAYGGSGLQFDWRILQAYNGNTPFLLSGGIGMDSLTELQQFSHPQWIGIDVNSRFETAPAVKDVGQIQSFIQSFKQLHTYE